MAAVDRFEITLRKASSSNWRDGLQAIRFDLAGQFLDKGRFDKACQMPQVMRAQSST